MLPCHASGLLEALQRAAPIQAAAWRQYWSEGNLKQQPQPEQQLQAPHPTSKCAWSYSTNSSAAAHHNTDSSSGNSVHSNSSMKATSSCGPCSSCTAQARAQVLTAATGLKALLLSTQHKPLHAPQHTFTSMAVQGSCLPSSSRGMACVAAAGSEAGATRARRSRRSVASPPVSPAVDSGTTTESASDGASPSGSRAASSSSRRTSRATSGTRTAKQAGQAAAAAAGGELPPGQLAQEAQQLLGQLQQYCEAYYAGRPLVSISAPFSWFQCLPASESCTHQNTG